MGGLVSEPAQSWFPVLAGPEVAVWRVWCAGDWRGRMSGGRAPLVPEAGCVLRRGGHAAALGLISSGNPAKNTREMLWEMLRIVGPKQPCSAELRTSLECLM